MNTRPGTPVPRRSLAWLVSVLAAGLTRVAHRGFARSFGGRAVLTIVASGLFAATAVAQYPIAGLIQGTDGNLYGTTYGGGASGMGTIFKIDTNGTTLTILRSFAFSAAPDADDHADTDDCTNAYEHSHGHADTDGHADALLCTWHCAEFGVSLIGNPGCGNYNFERIEALPDWTKGEVK